MRTNFDKKHFVKPERIFGRLVQEAGIPFKTKWRISKYEIDFLIGKVAVELDGHPQNEEKNNYLVIAGYIPVHFYNKEIYLERRKVLQKLKLIIKHVNSIKT